MKYTESTFLLIEDNVIVPADAHNAAEGFCVEGVEAFLLGLGKCP